MIKIVPAKTNDAVIISVLAQKIWTEVYKEILSKDQIDFMLNDIYTVESILDQMSNGDEFFLVIDDLEVLGFASFSETREEKVFKIQKLYISPKVHGKGAGRLMVSHIANLVLEKGGTILELNVNRNNPAKNFYLKLGFEIFKSVDIKYHHFLLNDYVMRRLLIAN